MVKLTDVVATERANLEALDCPAFDNPTVLPAASLKDSRVALISSAGLMKRSDDNIHGGAADYRTIDSQTRDRDLLMNHISINFDRTGFAEDANCVLPRERLNEMAESGTIAHAADTHYSFMGATAPEPMEPHVNALVATLKANNINTVCLLPV
jgi:D-proline reductase (dithiol) PrdB